MKISVLLCSCLFAIGLCEANDGIEAAKAQTYQAIDLHPLRDGMSHWRKRYGRDRNDPMYDPSQIVHIAENMLAYQNADGGWPNNVDWQAQIDPLSQVALERRTGYAWYGYWPARILEKDYPMWKNKNGRQK